MLCFGIKGVMRNVSCAAIFVAKHIFVSFTHTHTTHINRQYVCDLTEYPSINENIPEHDFPEKRFISSFREPWRYYH